MAESLDVSTLQPEGPVPFDFDAARDLASKLRACATLVTTQQLPRRRELACTARRDWRGNYAELFDTRTTQCRNDAERLATALRDAATKVDQLVEEAEQEQRRRDRANDYLIEHAAWRERERERNDSIVTNVLSLGGAFDDEPEMPDMTGEPSTLPVMDPSIGPRAEA